jgi:hypothetical protein
MKTLTKVSPAERPQLLSEIADIQQEAGGDPAAAKATLQNALVESVALLGQPAPPKDPRMAAGEMVDNDGKPVLLNSNSDDTRKASIKAQIAEFQARLGDLPAALKTFEDIHVEISRGRAALAIARARVRAGDVEGTLSWALALDPPAVRGWALDGLAAGTSKP